MILYHGSEKEIIKPLFGEGNPTNDYGLGFYLTKDKKVGELWASKYKQDGYLMSYSMNLDSLKVLTLDSASEEDVLKWITILIKNRFDKEARISNKETIDWLTKHFDVDINSYDVIVGYRADDSYFAYSKAFVEDSLSFESLTEAMKIGKLGKQYVLISKEAFKSIKHTKTTRITKSNDYAIFRDKTLREYHEIKNNDSIRNTYIRDIIRRYGN